MTVFNPVSGQMEETKTTLSEADRASLLDLAHLLRSMCAKVGRPEWLTISDSDFAKVIEAIMKPFKVLKLPDVFVLRLLASYSEHECNPSRLTMILVAQRIPWLAKYRSAWSDGLRALGAIVRSHVDVARLVAQDGQVRKLLGEAMIKWQARRGLEDLVIDGIDDSTVRFWYLLQAVSPRGGGRWWS